MPETLQELFEQDGVLGVLGTYGLDQVLTDQDDPLLWACALIQHWPAPWEPGLEPAALRFGVARIIPEENAGGQVTRSGMQQIEVWCFERVDADHLLAVECKAAPALSFMARIASGDQSAVNNPQDPLVRDYLDISRPTRKQEKALIHKGMSAPPNAGAGETRCWKKKEDGTWVETEEIFAHWLA